MEGSRATDGPSVAIGCQGGGSHTAFTAGVLQALFDRSLGPYDLVGISGTSGGALCAATAWYGLLAEGGERASELLESLWMDLSARGPASQVLNDSTRLWVDLEASGFPLPMVSPYENPLAYRGQSFIRRVVERHVDFPSIPDLLEPDSPRVLVSAVDVVDGTFDVFSGTDLTADAVVASTAVPRLFPAVEVDDDPHWDGLFAQNPPIRNFLADPDTADAKPDELWIIQINPLRQPTAPKTLETISDRRSELAGNLSLRQELAFVRQVNEWVDEGVLADDSFKHVDVRWIRFGEEFEYESRFDRDPAFIRSLLAAGRQAGREFLSERVAKVNS